MLTRNELGLLDFRDQVHTSLAGWEQTMDNLRSPVPYLMIDNSAWGHESDHWKIPRLVEFPVF